MIVGLSQEVCQQVQEIDTLERLKNNRVAMQATFDALIRLKDIVTQLKVLVVLLNGRLAEAIIQNTMTSMERLIRDVQESEKQLESQPRQVKELGQCQKKSQDLIDTLKAKWRLYASEHTRETLELLRLVDYLPEVEAKQAAYQKLIMQVQHYIEHTPLIPAQLVEFDEYLQELNQHLSNIEGLSVDVKKFLENVLNDQATLTDLTDDVLQWCRQGEHARVFMISFARNKRKQ